MIRFYFHPTRETPAKIALFLEEAGPPRTVRRSRSTREG